MKTSWAYGMLNGRTMGMATREAYGKTLAELGTENPNIVALDADLSKSTYSGIFGKAFPDRYFNVGIAEANMVSMASGLAAMGKIPFISSFAVFLMGKGFDQLRMGVAYPRHNVKVVVSHAGISIGEDGPSQMSVEDVAFACVLPGFVVLNPADEVGMKALVRAAASYIGPVFIRAGRPKSAKVYADHEPFSLTGAKRLSDGKDVGIIACGLMVAEAIEAAERLAQKGIEASVLDCYCIKPLPEEEILTLAKEVKHLMVIEEHLVHGGLGSRVAQLMCQRQPRSLECIGMNDAYAESGKPDELLKRYGLSADHLVEVAERLMSSQSSSSQPAPV